MQKVVIVGTGKLGLRHIQSYASIEAASVVGVIDPVVERRAAVLEQIGHDVKVYDDVDSAAGDPGVDVIDICSPTMNHFEHTAAALASGKSVFCEKPLVPTLREAEHLEAVVAESPGVLRVGYVYRFHPRMQRLKDLLAAGALGHPHLAMLRIGGRGSHRLWKHKAQSGGGALLDMATHMIDLAYWLFGSFENSELLYGTQLLHKREIEGAIVDADAEDLAIVRIRTVGDVEVLIHADFVTPGFANSVEVAGTNGSVATSIITSTPDRYTLVQPAGGLPAGETTFPGENSNMLQRQLETFVNDLEAGTVHSDMSASIEIARVIDGCRQ